MMTRLQITAFLGMSVAFWIILLALRGVPLSWEMFLPFSAVVSAVTIVLLIFDKWAWSWRIFRGWLIKRPYLHGTWKTELQSDWIDPKTKKGIPPINCYTVIRQTASMLSIRLITPESRSKTVSAAIENCNDGTFEVNGTYRNRPKSEYRHRSEVHYGSLLLTADTPVPNQLEGEYWTDRKTTGSLLLVDRKKATCMSFNEAEELFSST